MSVLQRLSRPARDPQIQPQLRAAYAVGLKRAWQHFWRRPVTCFIPSVGLMRLWPNNTVSFRLGIFEIWEPHITKFIRSRIRDGAVCIDVGANIGYYSLLMSRTSPSGKIYAVEPSPKIRAELDENLRLNGCTNVVVVPYGISDREEVLAFRTKEKNHGSSAFMENGDQFLALKPLASVIPEGDIAKTEILKIDVEGMEDRVLGDVLRLLPLFPQHLTICAELRLDSQIRQLLESFFNNGFRAIIIKNEYSSLFYANPKLDQPPTNLQLKDLQPENLQRLPDGMYDIALFRD